MPHQDFASHEPFRPRRSQRAGKQRGVTMAITATELEACGISRDDPPPTYKVWPGEPNKNGGGGMWIRLYP